MRRRSENCLAQIKTLLPKIEDDLYIAYHLTLADAEYLTSLFEEIRTEFALMVDENGWMDDHTKFYAKQKLSNMKAHIGDKELKSERVQELRTAINENDYVNNLIAIGNFFWKKIIQDMNKPKDRWSGENIDNAFYSPTRNEVQINTGLLKGFGYNIDMPKAILYGGSVSTTLGHELTHGFDDNGKNYGRLGNLFSWWEDVADAAYRSQSKCMVKQYNDFKIHHNGTAYSANGESTLGENIADSGGAKLGYRAFLKYLEKNEHKCLNSVDFSPKQLFWIGLAQDWCIFTGFDYETSFEG